MASDSGSSSRSPHPNQSRQKTEFLSTWNQTACRSYMRRALYFSLDNELHAKAFVALQRALDALAQQRVDLAGTLEISDLNKPGQVLLSMPNSTTATIPLETAEKTLCCDEDDDYADIKAKGFPQVNFKFNSHFRNSGEFKDAKCKPSSEPIPVSKALVSFLDGGMVFVFFLHHSLINGDGMGMVLDTLAQLTRDPMATVRLPVSRDLPLDLHAPQAALRDKYNLDGSMVNDMSAQQLVCELPEYSILPQASGPNVVEFHSGGTAWDGIEKSATIIKFRVETLKALANFLGEIKGKRQPPTIFNVIAALVWTHGTVARKKAESGFYDHNSDDLAQLTLTTNWKARVPGAKESYFGNSTVSPRAVVPYKKLERVCRDNLQFVNLELIPANGRLGTTHDTDDEEQCDVHRHSRTSSYIARKKKESLRGLASIAYKIHDALQVVDHEFVTKRTAFFEALESPQMLTQDRDPRDAMTMFTNNWRYIGADTDWDFTGNGITIKPDVIRRAEGGSGDICTMLVLPAKTGSEELEVLLELSKGAMTALQGDMGFNAFIQSFV